MTNLLSAFSSGATTITAGMYDVAEIAVPIVIAGLVIVVGFKWIKKLGK